VWQGREDWGARRGSGRPLRQIRDMTTILTIEPQIFEAYAAPCEEPASCGCARCRAEMEFERRRGSSRPRRAGPSRGRRVRRGDKPGRPHKKPRRPLRPVSWPWPSGVGVAIHSDTTAARDGPAATPDAGEPEPSPDERPSLHYCQSPVIIDGFERGEYRLRPHHYPALIRFIRRVAPAGSSAPTGVAIKIEGHSDDGGSRDADTGLAYSRALEVERLLTGVLRGLQSVVSSAGSSRPVASNTSERNRARNRRVELQLCRTQ
jgi:outer membrane protein OmpA-like peptidoglycan-associated protein